MEVLKKQSKVFKSRFKMMVEAQLDMINTEDWEDLLKYELDTSSVESVAEQELDIPNVDRLDEEPIDKLIKPDEA